jgi:hypothetical protein
VIVLAVLYLAIGIVWCPAMLLGMLPVTLYAVFVVVLWLAIVIVGGLLSTR